MWIPYGFGDGGQIFVFRVRESPAYASKCLKMQFHVQRQEPETAIVTVASRVFDGCAPIFMCHQE